MRHPAFLLPALLLILLSGCATPQMRIDRDRAAFATFPPAAQELIRAGRIDVGFTPAMVTMALGEPDRRLTSRSEQGEAEIWVYHDESPRLSLGFGVASGGRHSGVGVGMETSTGSWDPEEKIRVEFREGKVTRIEYRNH